MATDQVIYSSIHLKVHQKIPFCCYNIPCVNNADKAYPYGIYTLT